MEGLSDAQLKSISVMSRIKDTLYETRKEFIGMNVDKLVAEICVKFGASRRTAKDYIRTLVDSGFAYRDDDGDLWMNKKDFEARKTFDSITQQGGVANE